MSMYVGCARSNAELSEAIALSTRIFYPSAYCQEKARQEMRELVAAGRVLTPADAIIIVQDKRVCAACFMVERYMYAPVLTRAFFLSAICVDQAARGHGLSVILLQNALVECEKRGAAVAVVIARRGVDHFYTKFSFWGISQYSKVAISSYVNLQSPARLDVEAVRLDQLSEIARLHDDVYRQFHGALVRSEDFWRFALHRCLSQGIEFSCVRSDGRVIAYWIRRGAEVFELAGSAAIANLEIVALIQSNRCPELTLHVPAAHPIRRELDCVDHSESKRQCRYGGHMVRIVEPTALLSARRLEIMERAAKLGVTNSIDVVGDARIALTEGSVNIELSGSPLTFENTAFLIGSDWLSHPPFRAHVTGRSFNIPLIDQL